MPARALVVKVLSAGEMLLLYWTPAGAAAAAVAEPHCLELPLKEFTEETPSMGEGALRRV